MQLEHTLPRSARKAAAQPAHKLTCPQGTLTTRCATAEQPLQVDARTRRRAPMRTHLVAAIAASRDLTEAEVESNPCSLMSTLSIGALGSNGLSAADAAARCRRSCRERHRSDEGKVDLPPRTRTSWI